jgi:hypothetical protein
VLGLAGGLTLFLVGRGKWSESKMGAVSLAYYEAMALLDHFDSAARPAIATQTRFGEPPGADKSIEKLMEHSGRSGRNGFVRVEIRAYLQSGVGRIHANNVSQQAKIIDIARPGRPCLHCEDVSR